MAELLGLSQQGAQATIAESCADALLGMFFADFSHKDQPTDRTINRHSILHGHLVSYASEANSLRAFLMLATLHYFIAALLQVHALEDIRKHYEHAKWQKGMARGQSGANKAQTK